MRRLAVSAVIVLLISWPGCDSKPDRTQLRVFVADSLLRPLNTVAEAFMKAHPDVQVVQIPSGSVLAARKITEGNDAADVLAVADYMVIEKLMRPRHADWYICFATNEIVIAYTDASRGSAELTVKNWFHVLSRDGVTVAAANPLHDPCGYWTELSWRLADLYYGVLPDGGTILQRMTAKCGPPADRRSDAEQMLQLVESVGGVDYAFVYLSQAMQHHLQLLRLPPEVSLGNPDMADTYHKVYLDLPGHEPGKPTRRRGEPIVFAVTIPKVVRHSELAEKYVSFILGAEGRNLLTKEHIQVVDRPWTYDPDQVPDSLQSPLDARSRSPTASSSPGDGNVR